MLVDGPSDIAYDSETTSPETAPGDAGGAAARTTIVGTALLMYLEHFGLKKKPFQLAHDPAFYYSAAHQVPLNELCYAIEEHQGLAVVVGEPGTGKTTLLRRLLQSFSAHQRGVFLSDTALAEQSVLRALGGALGVYPLDRPQQLADGVRRVLLGELRAGRTTVLLVDEAQGLDVRQLEEIRSLTNLEAAGRKLVEIILAGQPGLETRLQTTPELAALRQRIAVRCRLAPLDLEQTHGYIAHRLVVSGAARPELFTPEAVLAIHEHSGGIPRLINIISERCLLVAYVEDAVVVDAAQVTEALADLRLEPMVEADADLAVPARSEEDVDDRADVLGLRLGFRLAALEEKLDLVLRALVRAGLVRPDRDAGSETMRRWLEELAREPGPPAAEKLRP